MFTIADIRNIALQIEKNGEQTYRDAAATCTSDKVKELFENMAEDERRHGEWFAEIQADKPLTEEQREMEAVGRTLLQEMVKNQTFSLKHEELMSSSELEDLINQSSVFEKDTIMFYEMLSGFIDDPGAMKELKKIIDEEKGHLTQLAELMESTVSPQ